MPISSGFLVQAVSTSNMRFTTFSVAILTFGAKFGAGWSVQHFLEPELSLQHGPRIRDLKTGQLNFLHTTDTHGWLGSHLLQPDYDADWGDFITFVSLFKEKRLSNDQDLIVVDTGDKHDGNGLSDATVPSGVETTRIFNELDCDLLTLGNHELYTVENTLLEYYSTVLSPKFADKYVSSNVELVKRDGSKVPFGNKYRYFETENTGTRVLALSFLFDFRRFNERALVTPALKELENPWFHQLTAKYPEESLDLILIFGHMPVTDVADKEIDRIQVRFRSIYPNTVIQFFGGHSHIRDFAEFDPKSTGLQSGRFAETVGFLSIDNVTKELPEFSRSYVDFNLRSFAHHLNTKHMPYTEKGLLVSGMVKDLRRRLKLDTVLGYVPRTYYISSKPLNSEENLYHLICHNVLPLLDSEVTNRSVSRFILMNTGSVRYDLYRGPFTEDTEFIVLPFTNEWLYLELPLRVASQIKDYLNKGPAISSLAPPQVAARSVFKHLADSPGACPRVDRPNLTLGYTTADDYGCDGDDTPHNTLDEYDIPNVVQSEELVSEDPDEIVHFVFYSFLKSNVLEAVNALTKSTNDHYNESHCRKYGGKSTKELLRNFIQELAS